MYSILSILIILLLQFKFRPKKKAEVRRFISPVNTCRKLNLFEEIERDHEKFLKEVSSGVYSSNVNSKFSRNHKNKGFLWDTTTNRKTDEFNPSTVLKIKFVRNPQIKVLKLGTKETAFSKFMEEIRTKTNSPVKGSDRSNSFLKTMISK